MEYRGRNIEENITNIERKLEIKLEGDNYFGEINLSKKEFNKFVDKLIKLRENISSDDRSIEILFDLCEGNSNFISDEEIPCDLSIYTIETFYETPNEKEKRIKMEKNKIDEEIEMEKEVREKQHKKTIKEAKKLLESEGYDVKKK